MRLFVDLADTLVADYDMVDVLTQLTENCVDLLDTAAAGLLLTDQRGRLHVAAASSERTELLELFQVQASEGPCLDCFRTGRSVSVGDLETAIDRWPEFVPAALAAGFVSVHAVPMRLRGDVIGGLNLFGSRRGVLSEADTRVAQALADTATIGILSERAIRHSELLTEQLQTALNNRITIEQAKGVLAHAGGIEMGEAFTALRAYGRANSTRLHEVALRLVEGTLPVGDVLGVQSGATTQTP